MTLLAYRFSAFGDVVMAATVIREIAVQNPNVNILFVSRKQFEIFFENIPNLTFLGIELEDYPGPLGMHRLYRKIIGLHRIDAVADLHDVIRTKILTRIFRLSGAEVAVIDKGKKEKKWLTDVKIINKSPLKNTVERYADVFRKLGLSAALSHCLQPLIQHGQTREGIGFAPFAQHTGKMYPLAKSKELLRLLAQKEHVYLFGGKGTEADILHRWEKEIPNVSTVAGKLSMSKELELISRLQLMVSMDSANMHLASFVGTRCVSIWCATHPFAGFLGYGQAEKDAVGQMDLTCRPCSVFGNRECFRGDYACQKELLVSNILQVIQTHLRK